MAMYREYQPELIIGEAESLVGLYSDLNYIPVYPDAIDLLELAQAGLPQPVESIELVYLRGTDAWQKRKKLRES
jgi:tRNA threonylcarbamoyladenosine biosynthesis protein TsaB